MRIIDVFYVRISVCGLDGLVFVTFDMMKGKLMITLDLLFKLVPKLSPLVENSATFLSQIPKAVSLFVATLFLCGGVSAQGLKELTSDSNNPAQSPATSIDYRDLASGDAKLDDRWLLLKEQLFAEKEVLTGTGVIQLQVAGRAFDGARVPVAARSLIADKDSQYIRKLYLIVDNNPLPVAGTFSFEPGKGWDTIDTELRINEYSFVRVVAELSDESLHMDSTFVKAVGGCSAPPCQLLRVFDLCILMQVVCNLINSPVLTYLLTMCTRWVLSLMVKHCLRYRPISP